MTRVLAIVCVVSCAFLIGACGTGINFKQLAKKTNRIQVHRIDKELGETVSQVTVTDQGEIKKLLTSVGNTDAPSFKCGHDYLLDCLQKDDKHFLIEVNSDEICRTAVFTFEDETEFRYFGSEGVELLSSYFN